jgi:hypothetical protein
MATNAARHDWPHCCTFLTSASFHFQPSFVLRSPGQPTALTHADPVWSILSTALGVIFPTRYAIELCQLCLLFDVTSQIEWVPS